MTDALERMRKLDQETRPAPWEFMSAYWEEDAQAEADFAVAARNAWPALCAVVEGIEKALRELGVPDEHYPAPVANAVTILRAALADLKRALAPTEEER